MKYTVTAGGMPGFVFGKVKDIHREGGSVTAYLITVRSHGALTRFYKDVLVSASRVTAR